MFSQTLQENGVLAKKIELDATKNWSKRRVTHNYCWEDWGDYSPIPLKWCMWVGLESRLEQYTTPKEAHTNSERVNIRDDSKKWWYEQY